MTHISRAAAYILAGIAPLALLCSTDNPQAPGAYANEHAHTPRPVAISPSWYNGSHHVNQLFESSDYSDDGNITFSQFEDYQNIEELRARIRYLHDELRRVDGEIDLVERDIYRHERRRDFIVTEGRALWELHNQMEHSPAR